MKKTRKMNSKGFSLIELIIAVAILVVLSGLLAPQLIKYIEQSREAKDIQMLDSVYTAINTALANEDAYDDYITNSASGKTYEVGKAFTLSTLTGGTDKFAGEVKSIIGSEATNFEFSSRRARASSSVVWILITQKEGVDGGKFLSVKVYSGNGSAGTITDNDFVVGN